MLYTIIGQLTIIAVLLIVISRLLAKGLKVMNEENTKLDEIATFIEGTLTPYIRGLVGNQKDPADAAEQQARTIEENRIFTALQALVPTPAAPETGGQTAIPTEPETTGEAA